MSKSPVTFRHNGEDVAIFTEAGTNLADDLRRRVGDFSVKFGCGQGGCGACTVLINGEPQLACLTLTETIEGRDVQTVAGIADGPVLHSLQDAFVNGFAAQCGFCTPGFLLAAKALLDGNPRPTRAEVIDAIEGNICRCTGYEPIVDAILIAASPTNKRVL